MISAQNMVESSGEDLRAAIPVTVRKMVMKPDVIAEMTPKVNDLSEIP
jgi:hypothetical protein